MTLSDTKDPVKVRHQMTTNASRTAQDVAGSRTADGVETFIARTGAIVMQTAHYRMWDA